LPSANLDTGRSIIRTAVPTSTSDFRSRNRKLRHDLLWRMTLLTPAREMTSRHGVDNGSLLPVEWDFGPLEVNTLFLSKNTIESAERAFTDFLIGELRR
jgi:hypothetical protein